MSPLRFEPRPLAPKFDWVELGNERASGEKHEQKITKEEEQVGLETVFLWKELIRPQIVEVDKVEENLPAQESFFPIL